MRGFAVAVASFLFAAQAVAQTGGTSLVFDGSFSDVVGTDHPECAEVFEETNYQTNHYLVGPSRRTIVTHFSREDETGFWHGQTFASNLGYNNDFYYEKRLTGAERDHRIKIYGIVDRNVVYMETRVDVLDKANVVLCRTTAVFSGFND